MGGDDDIVGIAVPNNNETINGDGNDNVMDENRNNERGKDIGNDANVVLGKSSDGDNGDGHNCDGIVNSNGGNDSNDVGNPPVIGKAVGGRKKKVKTGQQSMGGGDNNVVVDVPYHNETYSGDDNDDDLDENRSNERGKDVCNINVGKFSDGDNGDGDNSDGIVNNIGGNDSNNVGNQPDSGDAVGERKKKVKQASNLLAEVTRMLDLMHLTITKLTVVMDKTMFLMRTKIMKDAKMFVTRPTMLARFVMLIMVMVTTVMAL